MGALIATTIPFTWEAVAQKLDSADVDLQLVDVVLRKVANAQGAMPMALALCWQQVAGDQLEQRGLAVAVRANHCHARVVAQTKVELCENGLVVRVRKDNVVKVHNGA